MIKLSDVKVLTTINASLWPFRAALRPKNWPRSARHYGLRRHLVSTRAHYLHSGVNLDETQHFARGQLTVNGARISPPSSGRTIWTAPEGAKAGRPEEESK